MIKKYGKQITGIVVTSEKMEMTALSAVVTTIGLIFLLSVFEGLAELELPDEPIVVYEAGSKSWYGLLYICIVAPLLEEICMRGIVLKKLLCMFGNPWYAIMLSALLFGLLHGNMAQGISATAAGVVLGWMAYKTKSLIPGIIMHILNNCIASLQSVFLPDVEAYDHIALCIVLVAVGAVLLFYGLRMMARQYDCEQVKVEE